MPGYRRGFSRRRGAMSLNVVRSIKNIRNAQFGISGTAASSVIAKAVNTPLSTNDSDCAQGCVIKAIWLSMDVCGIGGTGVLNVADIYLIKNPGDNLTLPSPLSQGTSNEKKFIIKTWRAMIMRNQDGNVPYHWEGWIKIPKRYYRMGTDDTWRINFICTTGLTGHASFEAIYKWYT